MAERQNAMRLLPHERQLLVDAYLRWEIPIDQYETRTADLEALTAEWHKLSGRTEPPEDVIRYMRTQRKRSLWVRFDGAHKPAPPTIDLTAAETEILVIIFNDNTAMIDRGSDVLACEPDVAELIARQFAVATGRIVPANLLVAKLTALRKRGLLPKVESRPKKSEDTGFDDIDQVNI